MILHSLTAIMNTNNSEENDFHVNDEDVDRERFLLNAANIINHMRTIPLEENLRSEDIFSIDTSRS